MCVSVIEALPCHRGRQNMILDTFATWLQFVEVRDIRINSNNQADNVNSVIIDIIFTKRQCPNSTSSVTINFDSDINYSTTIQGDSG